MEQSSWNSCGNFSKDIFPEIPKREFLMGLLGLMGYSNLELFYTHRVNRENSCNCSAMRKTTHTHCSGINPLKCSGVRRLHFEVFSAIQV